jgi:hypothetical protein
MVAATAAAIARYADPSDAVSAGYVWIGDGQPAGGFRHFVNAQYLVDGAVLDPARIESLVYRTAANGSLELVSGMYILRPGATTADVPDVAGDLAVWHQHTDLCFTRDGLISGVTGSGACPPGSINADTPPMLHVWIVDNPDGPFAAIEGAGHVERPGQD